MTTDVETYRRDLLLALRLRDVPGPRIAEALAEVDSHLQETGEDPTEAFGGPRAYADELAGALGARRAGWRAVLGSIRASDVAVAAVSLLGGWLLPHGLFHLGAGDDALLGLPAVVPVAVGLALWLGLAVWLVGRARSDADGVLDPRTGADMVGPPPRWAFSVLLLAPAAALALSWWVGHAYG